MEQRLILNKKIAIIGGGACGCVCAKFLSDYGFDVTVFDKNTFLRTILPTGGKRCNLAHNIYDFKTLAQNYPRGEKFLYSLFSKFSTEQTLEFFDSIGVKTYSQDDGRIFPVTNSSKDVRTKILAQLTNCHLIKEEVLKIEKLDNCFKIKTNKAVWGFDNVVITIGGHGNFDLIKDLGINIIPPTQALVGFITREDLSQLSGVSLQNIVAKVGKNIYYGDVLFTHKGISGPLIYKLSSIYARCTYPLDFSLDIVGDIDFQEVLNTNSQKSIKNIIHPKALASFILEKLAINPDTPCHKINSKLRNIILEELKNFKITATEKIPEGETVTCGGVDLKEVNSKTLECKGISGLYFGGEVLDIDGFCGGYNLQNCWSCAYVIAQGILQKYS